jgi:SAM-dependent methyltransferase
MDDGDSGYQFGSGIGDDEVARLELQGSALAPATRMIFAEAGIRPGMRVLDLGCGAGDGAFVAAGLVGPDGFVVGVDRSAEALARARLRAGQRGLAQVRFVEGDLDDPAPGEQRRLIATQDRDALHELLDGPMLPLLRDGVPGAKIVYTRSSVDELEGTTRREARDAWSNREGITSWADLPEPD